ncbi:MAG TPA: DUF2971 domain-containing protein [Gallionella sp.]|nr:DUF2971 domain-containing protein [Gallionella sp.]
MAPDISSVTSSCVTASDLIGTRIPLGITDLDSHALFTGPAPDRLFHYTTLNGLRGIVESKSLWLTRTAYLNDRSELKDAISLFQSEANIWASNLEAANVDVADLLTTTATQLDSFHETHICLASFCEDGDLLSQWRGYGGSGSGVALGFSGQTLERVNRTGWAKLLRCLYDTNEHRQVIRDLIRLLIKGYETWKKVVSSEKHASIRKELIGYFNTTFLQVAPALKNMHFAAEKEWRIVTLPRSTVDPKFRSFLSNERVSQYYIYEFEPAPTGDYDFLPSVVIGPTSEPRLVADAVGTLCSQSKVGFNEMVFSQIPYRGTTCL